MENYNEINRGTTEVPEVQQSNIFANFVKNLTDKQLLERNLLVRFQYSQLEDQGKMTQEKADTFIELLKAIKNELLERNQKPRLY